MIWLLLLLLARPIDVTVHPVFAVGKGDLVVYVKVEPHPDNRELKIEVDSGSFYQSTYKQLPGADAPRRISERFKDIPPGDYVVTAALLRAPNRVFTAEARHCRTGLDISCHD